MKATTFVEFYRADEDGYYDVLGSDGVAYLDGRFGRTRMRSEANRIGKARGFDGYRLCRGTHTDHVQLTREIQPIR